MEQLDFQDEEHQEDEEEDRDSNTEESTTEVRLQNTSNEDGEVRRGRGRLKLLKTGQPGRPKKRYQTRNMTKTPDPESVPDALNRDDNKV